MPDVLIQLGMVVFVLCVLVGILEAVNGGRGKQERAERERLIVEAWKRDHP